VETSEVMSVETSEVMSVETSEVMSVETFGGDVCGNVGGDVCGNVGGAPTSLTPYTQSSTVSMIIEKYISVHLSHIILPSLSLTHSTSQIHTEVNSSDYWYSTNNTTTQQARLRLFSYSLTSQSGSKTHRGRKAGLKVLTCEYIM